METIMSLVIDESEEISPELLSCLLGVVKKDNKDMLPIAQKLVERVMGDCATKLKPCLLEFIQSTGASLNDYNKVVSSICHENSDALENSETNTSGETMAEDNKLSERTVSDEMLQVSMKLEQEVGSPEKDRIVANNSPKVASSNGTFQLGNGDSIAQPVSPKQMPERSRCSGQSKDAIAASLADVESVAIKPDGKSDPNTKKEKDQKTNLSAQLTDTADHSRVENDTETPAVSSRTQCQSKEADHLVHLSGKEDVSDVPLDHDTSNGQQNNLLVESSTPRGISQVPSQILPESTRRKRGRPAGRKSTAKKIEGDAVDHQSPASGQKNLPQDEEILPKNNKSKKEPESISDSEGKSRIQAGKKSQLKTAAGDESPAAVTSDTKIKTQRHAGKDHSVDLSGMEDVSDVPLDHDTSNGQQCSSLVESSTPRGTSQGPSKILPESTRSKRGRPAGRKSTAKQNDGDAVAHQSPASGQKNLPQDEEIVPKNTKKEPENISDSEGKSQIQAGKKSQLKIATGDESPVAVKSDMEIKTQRHAGKKRVKRKVFSRESSREKHKSNVKKEQVSPEEDAAGEPSSKEIVSSPRTATKATSIDESQLVDSKKPASRKKHSQGIEETMTPEASDGKKMGDDIVGSRIKVWWPDDKKFYDGVIDSFDHMTMKHMVVYTDGDIEVLSLSKERWEFTGGDIEGIEKDPKDIDDVEMTHTKTGRGTPSSLSKQAKRTLQSKSGAESNDKAGKRRKGRPPGGASNLEKDDGSSLTSRKSKGRAVVRDEGKTPTSNSKLKDEPEKTGSMDATIKMSKPGKSGDGSKDDTNNLGGKTKGNTAKIDGSSKHVLTRSGRKSKTSKSGEGTSKSCGKSSESSEVTPKTGTRSEVDVPGAGTQPNIPTSRTKKLNKSVSGSPNGAASKEKVKLQENENIAEAKDGATSGTKRGRKRRKTSQN